MGLAGGGAFTNIDNKISDSGSTDVDSYEGLVYLSYHPESFYVDAAFTLGLNHYTSERDIEFGGIHRSAVAHPRGLQLTALVSGGYVYPLGGLEIVPLASLEYSHLNIERYDETGAGALNLTVNSQHYDLLQSGVGIKLVYPINDPNGSWTPEVHFKWLYDFVGDEQQTTSTFTLGGPLFATHGLEPAQSSFNVGAGFQMLLATNVSMLGNYDFEWKEDFYSHSGAVTVRVAY